MRLIVLICMLYGYCFSYSTLTPECIDIISANFDTLEPMSRSTKGWLRILNAPQKSKFYGFDRYDKKSIEQLKKCINMLNLDGRSDYTKYDLMH